MKFDMGQAPAPRHATEDAEAQPLSKLRHSIRTAFNHIIGYAEMLLEEQGLLDSGAAAELQKLAASARRLNEQIRSALSAPREHAARWEVYDEILAFLDHAQSVIPAFKEAAPDLADDFSKIEEAGCSLRSIAGGLLTASEDSVLSGESAQRPLATARILAVDDDAGNREILCRQLERQGHTVEAVSRGADALERLQRQAFDLILLDVVMPEWDGFHVLQRIRSDPRLASIPVIMLSALDELENVARCLEMGAADFISKPFDQRLLRARIESLLSRRRAEVESARMAESFRLLLESTAEGIFGINEHGVCTFINASGCKLLGRAREELLGRRLHSLIHVAPEGDAAESEPCPMEEAARAGRRSRVLDDTFFRKDGGRMPVEYSANPIFQDGAVRGAVITFTDVSERKRAEESMRQAAKLESLGILAGGIAHDFNNLLTGVLGNASLLESLLTPADPNRQFAQEIITASERAAELTAQMLAYAGKGSFVIRSVNLSELVRGITALIHSSIPRTAVLDVRCGGELMIEADPMQVQQVVMNLVINAGEALEQGAGSVTVTTGIREIQELQPAQPEPLPAGRYAVIEVADTGSGITPEASSRIFDPFFTTKFVGRGLGLAATLGIVRAHKGGITVESTPGKGSTFRVFFPASTAAAPAPPPPQVSQPVERGSETILIVDDEDTVRDTAARALRQYGYNVVLASGGREAVQELRERRASVSLILLDLSMPGMSGTEAVRYLRAIDPNIPILISSGYDEAEVTQKFVPHGITGFVRKPYRADQIVNAVSRALHNDPQRTAHP